MGIMSTRRVSWPMFASAVLLIGAAVGLILWEGGLYAVATAIIISMIGAVPFTWFGYRCEGALRPTLPTAVAIGFCLGFLANWSELALVETLSLIVSAVGGTALGIGSRRQTKNLSVDRLPQRWVLWVQENPTCNKCGHGFGLEQMDLLGAYLHQSDREPACKQCWANPDVLSRLRESDGRWWLEHKLFRDG